MYYVGVKQIKRLKNILQKKIQYLEL